MTNILLKPHSQQEMADFIVEKNHNNGLRIEETDTALFALEGYEIVENDAVVDISSTAEYQNQIRLKEIELELIAADSAYQDVLDAPIQYTNGFSYKPNYVESYALLIASGIGPLNIWDSTELNSASMTLQELSDLTVFLENTAEPAFQARKIARKALLEEKELLENNSAN